MINPRGPKTTRATVTIANERKVRFTNLSFQGFLPLFHELKTLVLFQTSENVCTHVDRLNRLTELLVQARGGNLPGDVIPDRVDQRFLRHNRLTALREQIIKK